jgi:uncharacterized repeat protein (TIGR03803 family)
VVQGSDGNFYGTTFGGGAQGLGTVFKITPGGTFTGLYSFCSQNGCTDGEFPYAPLVQATDGNFYGTTANGGAYEFGCLDSRDCGTVFKVTAGGALTTLYSFCSQSGCPDGYYPYAGLVQATDGNFYGTTRRGGASLYYGTVFKITPGGTLTTLHSFCSESACTDGGWPYAGLVQATDGNLYGTTWIGGANTTACGGSVAGGNPGCGTVFKITPGGTLTTLYSFCSQSRCTDGDYPQAGLVQGTDGNFYGTTSEGGAYGGGTVFKITPGGTLTTLYSFCSQSGCTDGTYPLAGLVQDTDQNLYGTTFYGGASEACAYGCGTIFSLSVGLGPFVETQPTSGWVGEAVKILGTSLTGATRVMFNGHVAVFKVVSSSLITTTVPAGATTGKVQVVTPSRTLYSNVLFRVPPSFSPESPGADGGGD